jgi:hypothetical protein
VARFLPYWLLPEYFCATTSKGDDIFQIPYQFNLTSFVCYVTVFLRSEADANLHKAEYFVSIVDLLWN